MDNLEENVVGSEVVENDVLQLVDSQQSLCVQKKAEREQFFSTMGLQTLIKKLSTIAETPIAVPIKFNQIYRRFLSKTSDDFDSIQVKYAERAKNALTQRRKELMKEIHEEDTKFLAIKQKRSLRLLDKMLRTSKYTHVDCKLLEYSVKLSEQTYSINQFQSNKMRQLIRKYTHSSLHEKVEHLFDEKDKLELQMQQIRMSQRQRLLLNAVNLHGNREAQLPTCIKNEEPEVVDEKQISKAVVERLSLIDRELDSLTEIDVDKNEIKQLGELNNVCISNDLNAVLVSNKHVFLGDGLACMKMLHQYRRSNGLNPSRGNRCVSVPVDNPQRCIQFRKRQADAHTVPLVQSETMSALHSSHSSLVTLFPKFSRHPELSNSSHEPINLKQLDQQRSPDSEMEENVLQIEDFELWLSLHPSDLSNTVLQQIRHIKKR
jgi:hypothetical protein